MSIKVLSKFSDWFKLMKPLEEQSEAEKKISSLVTLQYKIALKHLPEVLSELDDFKVGLSHSSPSCSLAISLPASASASVPLFA